MDSPSANHPVERGSIAYLAVVCLVATLGGLLFGYDTAVISGAIGFLGTHFEMDSTMVGWSAGCALIGCVIGVIIAGVASDRIGRKKVLLLSAILFLVSAIGTAIPQTLTIFIIFRVIGGIGVGAASMTSPMYIAEISPARIRGRMVSVNQLAIVSGMLVVYFVNFFIGSHGTTTNHQAAADLLKQLPPEVVLSEPASRIVENRVATQIESYRRAVDPNAVKEMAAILDQALAAAGLSPSERLGVLDSTPGTDPEKWDAEAFCTTVAIQLSEYGLPINGETAGSLARRLAAQFNTQVDLASLAQDHMASLLETELAAGHESPHVPPARIAASLIGPVKSLGASAWNVTTGWRWMFGSEALPALLLLTLLFFVPESPRFLTKQGHEEEAREILARVDGDEHASREMSEIKGALEHESSSLTQLLQPGMRVVLVIGILLAVLQQVTGINVFLYYAPEILKSVAGSNTDVALLQTVLVGAVNLGFTVLAILIVDKVGRKPLMIIGAAGMGVSLAAIGLASYAHAVGPWMLIFMLGYIASFAMSVGPVTWVILSEIFPTKVRGRALAIATFFLWGSNFIVSQTFPMMDGHAGLVATFNHGFPFLLYAVFCVVLVAVMVLIVPETKGRSLEEIERMWIKKP